MEWYDWIAWIALLAQLLFVYNAVRNYHYALTKYARRRHPRYRPTVALIVPCKGLDARFSTNIRSFFQQDYSNYRLLFVVGAESDPAYAELCQATERLRADSQAVDVQVLVAGPSTSCSQKIHNLLHAIDRLPSDVEILAFADSDVCVHPHWLGRLVWPLRRPKCGVATGYRWFVPAANNLATLAMSALNGSVAQLLGNSPFNHAWGGSMAVRAEDFRRFDLPRVWQNTLSDDLSLSATVRKAGTKVIFVPSCLVASVESITWAGLFEFARRQFLITRIYTPGTWWLGLLSTLGSVAGLWGGAALAWYAAATGQGNVPLYAAVPIVFLASQTLRAVLRQSMARRILSEHRAGLKAAARADILGGPLWSLLLLVLILSSACGRTIRWRGIRYRLISATETKVLDNPPV